MDLSLYRIDPKEWQDTGDTKQKWLKNVELKRPIRVSDFSADVEYYCQKCDEFLEAIHMKLDVD